MLLIDPQFRRDFEQLGLASCESIINHFLSAAPPPKAAVLVLPKTFPPAGESAVFYKQYEYRRPSWRFIGRASKARREFHNYGVFAALDIPSAARVACGEQRDALGRLRRAFIITRAIPEARTLVEFFRQCCPDRATAERRELRAALLRQLAAMTRRIHDAEFFHSDLVWRNILVTWRPPATPQLWWIDCPRGHFNRWSPFRHRQRIKDLASLDKSAARFCSRGERIEFVKRYLDKTRLDAEAKKLIADELAYRKRRWPEDWV